MRKPLAHHARVLRTIAAIEFKTRYADSALGYAWSFAKPFAYFGILWLIFDKVLKLAGPIAHFEIYLIIGVVLLMFFIDTVSAALPSIAARGSILRRIRFSPLVLPLSTSLTALMTFAVNLGAVAIFIAFSRITPQVNWLLVVPLLAELYLFTLGVGLLLTTLYVRFRDVGQIWELAAQLFIFATPLMYPASLLPLWAAKVMFLNPFVQVMQDVRALIVGTEGQERATADAVFGLWGHTLPITIALATFFFGLWLFRRESRHFAEQV